MDNLSFHANGKLLITGEYAVLDGAEALALPVKLGQKLKISGLKTNNDYIFWNAFLVNGELWFTVVFSKETLAIVSTTDREKAIRLQKILYSVKSQNKNSFKSEFDLKISTYLEFPINYGLGSSSTLISLIAQWTNTNAYKLLEDSFGGSGYDLACAVQDYPLRYSIKNKKPVVESINFKPKFCENLFFVFLNEKQNSRDGIKRYRQQKSSADFLKGISCLTQLIVQVKTIEAFEELLYKHEELISDRIGLKPVKQIRFKDYPYAVKSLGAWGGDFVLVSTRNKNVAYFLEAGYKDIYAYSDFAY